MDIIDEAQYKEDQLNQQALDRSTRLTRPPQRAKPGTCVICQRYIPTSRQQFFAEQGITAFLCGQESCETTYLKTPYTPPTNVETLDEETPDD